jgi:DNA invertase Pin-like site-specific DNA recombinase
MQTPQFVAYYRVSSRKQGRSGLGLAGQRQAVQDYVKRQGGEMLAEYTEVESGRRDDRPQLTKALAACRLRRAVLVVAKLDRLARKALTILRFIEEAGVEFVALDHPHASKLTLTIFAAIAEHEAELISQRTKAALAQAKVRGVRLGGHAERLSGAARRKGARLSAEARAERATKFAQDLGPVIHELCPHARSLREIAACLNAHGWPAPRGGEWTAVQVSRVLVRIQDDGRRI